MKMEVLSVQNQYQGQFSVIGSTKVKDWTSPLTPPPPSNTHNKHNSNNKTNKNNQSNSKNTQSENFLEGVKPKNYLNHRHRHHHHNHNQHLHYNKKTPSTKQVMETVAAATAVAVETDKKSPHYVYNNNLFCCKPTTIVTETLTASITVHHHNHDQEQQQHILFGCNGTSGDDIDTNAVNELSQCLQAELRAAKSQHLACTEVSLPWNLTSRIATEVIRTSEREPCGVRGCAIFIEFEDEPNNTRRIASFKVDPHTVSTFELYLTLKQEKSGWTSLLPQFLKNLTRSSTIFISPDFTLTKNKLYSCD